MARDIDQEPGGVAARARPDRQGLFRGLHARFHPDEITHALLQPVIQADQEIDGSLGTSRQRLDEVRYQRAGRLGRQIGGEVEAQVVGINEREILRISLDEEIERIDDRQVGGQVDLDPELLGLFRKHQPRQPVAVRVLLPVDEMLARPHVQGIARNLGPAMRRGAQADHLRSEADRPVVAVGGDVVQGD